MKAIQTITLVVLVSNEITAVANNFGGPDTVENQIAEDAATHPAMITERASQSWFDWKAALQQDHGLSLGVDYSAVYLGAIDALANDSASGGMIRFFGSWELVGRGTKNTGALV